MAYACLSLLTDYGALWGYVGVCHAVALSIAPSMPVIDIAHNVPPHDVRSGAFLLERTIKYVPPGVHVAVVDPGVGGTRRPVAVQSGERVFVGPDNGLLPWAVDACGGPDHAVVLDNQELWLTPRSRTFDGRDVFVPVAARIAMGKSVEEVGSSIPVANLVRLERPITRILEDSTAELEVLHVDTFGNVQLSGTAETAVSLGLNVGDRLSLHSPRKDGVTATYGSTYGDVPPGRPLVLVDSDGYLAVAVNLGRAETLLSVTVGDLVRIRLPSQNDAFTPEPPDTNQGNELETPFFRRNTEGGIKGD